MKTIQISDEIYAALEREVRGFGDTPETVLRRLLKLDEPVAIMSPEAPQSAFGFSAALKPPSPILELVQSSEYLQRNAKGRYFKLLKLMYLQNPKAFEKLDGLRCGGKRIQISTNPAAIESSGKSTFPQKLDDTPYWILTNLSNRSKQDVLTHVMRTLGYSLEEMVRANQTFSDDSLPVAPPRMYGGVELVRFSDQ